MLKNYLGRFYDKSCTFDFDGVIANSEIIHMRSFQELLAPLGIKISIKDGLLNSLEQVRTQWKTFNEYK